MIDTRTVKKSAIRTRKPLSAAQLQQRRDAAKKSTGPRTLEGKARSSRNAWKHGLTSTLHTAHFDNGMQSLLGAMGKPCQTTCPQYPCSLVDEGHTSPGGSCLDKRVYVQAFGSIIDALEKGSMDGMHGLMAAEISAALQMLHQLRAEVADQGFVIGVPAINDAGQVIYDKDGKMVMGKYLANPGYPMMIKTLEVLGISLPELLVTPQAKAKAKVQEEATDAMQTVLGGIFQRAAAAKGPRALTSSERDP